MQKKNVVGMFDDRSHAESAIHALHQAGFSQAEISVSARDRDDLRSITDATGSKAAEAAGAGATAGTVIGGLAGLLVGAGLLVIPGVGPLLAAGPFAAAVGSAGAIAGTAAAGAGLGAATGGVVGALIGLGVPEEEAETYAEGLRRGGILVMAEADSPEEEQRAKAILRGENAVDISTRRDEYRSSGWSGFDESAPEYDLSGRTVARPDDTRR